MSSSSNTTSPPPPPAAAAAENSNASKRPRLEGQEEEDKRASIADLAPFVAAVLRDRTLEDLVREHEDLVRENQRLRRESQRNERYRHRFKVTIVDQNNGTILAEADLMEDSSDSEPSEGWWAVEVYHGAASVDFESVGPLEVKVGNRTVDTINVADIRVSDAHVEESATVLCEVGLQNRPYPRVSSCGIRVDIRGREELPEALLDFMDQHLPLGLLEMLRQLKNIDPEVSFAFDSICIDIRNEQLLARF